MKIFSLGEEAIRPRILMIDFEKADAQALRDCGYKVYLGSSGFEDGVFNIPIEPYRIDIVIYRVAYNKRLPKPDEEMALWSAVDSKIITYKVGDEKEGRIWYRYPELAPVTRLGYRNFYNLSQDVLAKGGSILIFLGNIRIEEDETLMKSLLMTTEESIYRSGGLEGEYELFFNYDHSLDLGDYFKDLITGKSGHSFDFLRGIPYKDLQLSNKGYSIREFNASDENGIVYAYFKNRGGTRGNFMLLPDYSSANIDIIKHVLSKLPPLSPKDLFNKNYAGEAWLEKEQYGFSDELGIIQQKEEAKKELENRLVKLENSRIKIRSNTDYFRAILKNGDDDNTEESEHLKPPLKKVLEWLGIEVIDLDIILQEKAQALQSDFILKADGKEILCEAKGVTTGPRAEYVNQLNKHIIRYSQLVKQPALPGILILNYQRDIDPNIRSDFYTDAAIIAEAQESAIGILDTRELFNICKKIYGNEPGAELKKKARELILSIGVIHSRHLQL
jgi:hypothetical protein